MLGRGAAGPGNPSAAGVSAARAVGSALRSALLRIDPATVAAGVAGVAGCSAVADPAVADAFAREWAALGLTCEMSLVGDAATAFAAGGDWRAGAVLISGTGAVAALVDDLDIGPVADGLGWLLGDEGSGLWLGLQATRRAVRGFDSALGRKVAAHAGAANADELVHWAQALPPFGALAPLVCELADAGDPDASAIVAEAAGRLVSTLDSSAPRPHRSCWRAACWSPTPRSAVASWPPSRPVGRRWAPRATPRWVPPGWRCGVTVAGREPTRAACGRRRRRRRGRARRR
ncbi:BadF/BadG/BcrA/BcrD ATPase family protein [Dactylosporangium darangshiense]|uniref:BadF/BadG/BcrA/BcrD ATPase family protein n=1 Tax=Dactylosporangium darangshiense TaxID=579108 RepID=UPI00363350B0